MNFKLNTLLNEIVNDVRAGNTASSDLSLNKTASEEVTPETNSKIASGLLKIASSLNNEQRSSKISHSDIATYLRS